MSDVLLITAERYFPHDGHENGYLIEISLEMNESTGNVYVVARVAGSKKVLVCANVTMDYIKIRATEIEREKAKQ